jgi:hypothetical protein
MIILKRNEDIEIFQVELALKTKTKQSPFISILILAQEQEEISAETLQENDTVQIDCEGTPQVKNSQGQILTCHAVPSFLMDMVNAGGLVNVLKHRMADKAISMPG